MRRALAESMALEPVVALLFGLLVASGAGAAITVDLSGPTYGACGEVRIRGSIDGGNREITNLLWDWGDGSTSASFFPAVHTYTRNGTYTVTATAISSACSSESATVRVTVGNAGQNCPRGGPRCFRLWPPVLHLTAGGVSGRPLKVQGPVGNSAVSYESFDPDLVAVSARGRVEALRQEESGEIGTLVAARVDGERAGNFTVTRVLSQDYGLRYRKKQTKNTLLYFPRAVDGQNILQRVQEYQVPKVLEAGYKIETELTGVLPAGGCKQIFEVDFGEDEPSRVCGLSGHPIRLGWNIRQGNNCFMTPSGPQWFVILHELGHNVTLPSGTFWQALGGTFDPNYVENLASAVAMVAMEEVLESVALSDDGREALSRDYERYRAIFQRDFDRWLSDGARFGEIGPNMVDGIWLGFLDDLGAEFAARFFSLIGPSHEAPLADSVCRAQKRGQRGKHSFFVAMMSAAAREDLFQLFKRTYHFPLSKKVYRRALKALEGALAAPARAPAPRTLTPLPELGPECSLSLPAHRASTR